MSLIHGSTLLVLLSDCLQHQHLQVALAKQLPLILGTITLLELMKATFDLQLKPVELDRQVDQLRPLRPLLHLRRHQVLRSVLLRHWPLKPLLALARLLRSRLMLVLQFEEPYKVSWCRVSFRERQ